MPFGLDPLGRRDRRGQVGANEQDLAPGHRRAPGCCYLLKMRRRRLFAALLAVVSTAAAPVPVELPEPFSSWNRPVSPFRIAGNLYYVGANEIAAYLFVTPEGHILLDGGFEQTAPLIKQSVEALGFSLDDVEILLNSHAHSDHAGGLAALREWSGAELVASIGDAPLLEAGGEEPFPFPPVLPDRLIKDRDTVELGGTVLTGQVTAGHTPGCTTWTTALEVDGEPRAAVFICSVNALSEMDLLSPDSAYPEGRIQAFERSLERLADMPCELFLGSHGSFFLLEKKRRELETAEKNPFVDPALCRRHVEAKRDRFRAELARQRAASQE